MKQVLFFIMVAFLIQACTGKEAGSMSDQAKKNSESMNGIIMAIEAKDLNRLDSFMAEDIIENSSMQGRIQGLANVKADLQQALTHSLDMKSEVIRELADDEYVMSWVRFKGTMAVDMMGLKKGDPFESTSVEVARFNKDNKAIEHWTFMEVSEVMKMMGGDTAMPADTSGAAKRDTTVN